MLLLFYVLTSWTVVQKPNYSKSYFIQLHGLTITEYQHCIHFNALTLAPRRYYSLFIEGDQVKERDHKVTIFNKPVTEQGIQLSLKIVPYFSTICSLLLHLKSHPKDS